MIVISGDDSDGEGGMVEPKPDRAPPKKDSYAYPMGRPYLERVSDIDTEDRVRHEVLASRARQAHARSQVKTVTLRWWTKVCPNVSCVLTHIHRWLLSQEGGRPEVVEFDLERGHR